MKLVILSKTSDIYPLQQIKKLKSNNFKFCVTNEALKNYYKYADFVYCDKIEYIKFLYDYNRYMEYNIRNGFSIIPVQHLYSQINSKSGISSDTIKKMLDQINYYDNKGKICETGRDVIEAICKSPKYKGTNINSFQLNAEGHVKFTKENKKISSVVKMNISESNIFKYSNCKGKTLPITVFGNDESINKFDFEKMKNISTITIGANRIWKKYECDYLTFVDFKIAEEIVREQPDLGKTKFIVFEKHIKRHMGKNQTPIWKEFKDKYKDRIILGHTNSKIISSITFGIEILNKVVFPDMKCKFFFYGSRLKWAAKHHFWHKEKDKNTLNCTKKLWYSKRLTMIYNKLKAMQDFEMYDFISIQKDSRITEFAKYLPLKDFLNKYQEKTAFVFCSDLNFTIGMNTLIKSLNKYNKNFEHCDRILITDNIEHHSDMTKIIKVNTNEYKSIKYAKPRFIKAYYKFEVFKEEFLKEYDKIVFVDSDAICLKSMWPFLCLEENKEFPILMAKDDGIQKAVTIKTNDNNIKLMNTGVMIINCKEFLKYNFREGVIKHGNTKRSPDGSDQGVINQFILENKIPHGHLPIEMNCLKRIFYHDPKLWNKIQKNITILHYVGEKPWGNPNTMDGRRYSIINKKWQDLSNE